MISDNDLNIIDFSGIKIDSKELYNIIKEKYKKNTKEYKIKIKEHERELKIKKNYKKIYEIEFDKKSFFLLKKLLNSYVKELNILKQFIVLIIYYQS